MNNKVDDYDMDTFIMIVELDNGIALHYEFEDVHSLGALQKFMVSFLCSKDHQPNVQIRKIQISPPNMVKPVVGEKDDYELGLR